MTIFCSSQNLAPSTQNQFLKKEAQMRKLFLGTFLVFVSFILLDALIHGFFLRHLYERVSGLWRPDIQAKAWIMIVLDFMTSFLFVYIFTKGRENKGIAEGIRYGLLMGLFFSLIGVFGQYVVYPLPLQLAISWFIFNLLEFIIAGIITALVFM
jgi:hypothetical protein